MPSRTLYTPGALPLCLVALAAGCSDGATIIDLRTQDEMAGAADGAPMDPALGNGNSSSTDNDGSPLEGEAVEPLYVVGARVQTDDDQILYINTTTSLDEGVLSLEGALEYPGGGGGLVGPYKQGVFYLGSQAEPIVDKWRVTESGGFEKLGTVSFANLGLTNAFLATYRGVFPSEDRAYFVQDTDLIVWDPDAMQIVEAIPLPHAQYTGEGTFERDVAIGWEASGGRMLITIVYRSPEDANRYAPLTYYSFDFASQTFSEPIEEQRAGFLLPFGLQGADGTRYYSPNASRVLPSLVFGEGYGTPGSMLRIVPPHAAFDEGYAVDLSALVGGRPAGDFTPVSSDFGFIAVWHAELVPELTPENYAELRNQVPGYRYWTWRIGDAQAQDNVEQEPSRIAYGGEEVVDGKVYSRVTNADGLGQLVQMTPEGTVRPGLVMQAGSFVPGHIVRVR
jgi:hypothetical protein